MTLFFPLSKHLVPFFLVNIFDNFMLNLFVAFLFEGNCSKFTLMTFFSVLVRTKQGFKGSHTYIGGKGGFNDSKENLMRKKNAGTSN